MLNRFSTSIPVSIGFLFGVGVGLGLHLPQNASLLLLSSFAIGVFWYLNRHERSLVFLSIFLVAANAGVYKSASVQDYLSLPPDGLLEKEVVEVVSFPRRDSSRQQFEVEWNGSYKVLVNAPLFPRLQYGDRIEISGLIREPPVFEDFDYRAFLARKGISGIISYPEVRIVSHSKSPLGLIHSFRSQLEERIDSLFAEPHATLLSGMLIGIEGGSGGDLYEDLRRSGLLHVVVVSGTNVMFVVIFFQSFFSFLKRGQAFSLASFGVLFYLFLVGLSPPVLRASVMALTTLFSRALGRQQDGLSVLLLAGSGMVFVEPALIASVSFQLSFLAFLGLLALSRPLMEVFLGFLSSLRGASEASDEAISKSGREGGQKSASEIAAVRSDLGPRDDGLVDEEPQEQWDTESASYKAASTLSEALSSTLSATLFVLPVIAHNFGEISVTTIPANLLSFLLIEPIMFFGGLSLVGSIFSSDLGSILAAVASVPLEMFIKVAEVFASPSWAMVEVYQLPVFWWGVYYLGVGWGLIWLQRHNRSLKSPK